MDIPADGVKKSPPRQAAMAGTAAAKIPKSRIVWLALIIVVVVLAILGIVFHRPLKSFFLRPDKADLQAVFLTNGQVYFGEIIKETDHYIVLSHIYYLQTTPVLQTKTEGQPGTTATQQQQQLSLVKLGNELHGPMDEMRINREQVLFVEDLKKDGRVSQAIKDYESRGK